MKEHFWCRSRFWLCHFLNNRHRRTAIDWDVASSVDHAVRRNLAELMRSAAAITGHDHRWLVEQALRDCPDDPAYIQCLRLFAKEVSFLETLVQRFNDGDADPQPGQSWIAKLTLPV